MKQFLLNISLIITLLFSSINVWGQTQVADGVWKEGNTYYTIYNEEWEYYDVSGDGNKRRNKTYNFKYPSNILTFEARTTLWSKSNINIESCNLNESLTLDDEFDNYDYDIQSHTCRYIKFYESNTAIKYFQNIKLQMAPHIILDESIYEEDEYLYFGEIDLSSNQTTVSKDINFHSFLTSSGITVTSSNPAFKVTKNATIGANVFEKIDANNYSIEITFAPEKPGYYDEVITITDAGIGTYTVKVKGYAKGPQTITWNDDLSGRTYQDVLNGKNTITLRATASSGLDVTYSSSDELVATINGNILTIVGAGKATITATQAGNNYYFAAESVTKTLEVGKIDQSITWNDDLSILNLNNPTTTLTATASSGLGVTYTSRNTNVAIIEGNKITIVGGGEATITASQSGNQNYNAAESITKTITIDKLPQTITWEQNLSNITLGDVTQITLTATTDGDGQLTYTSSNESVVTVSGNVMTIVGEGYAVVTVTASETKKYYGATAQQYVVVLAAGTCTGNVVTSFDITNSSSTIAISGPADKLSFKVSWSTWATRTIKAYEIVNGVEKELYNENLIGDTWFAGSKIIGPLQLTENASHIKIDVSGSTLSSVTASDIVVTRKKYFRYNENEVIDFGDVEIGENPEEGFTLQYSNLDEDVTFYTAKNSIFSVSKNGTLNMDCDVTSEHTTYVTINATEVGEYTDRLYIRRGENAPQYVTLKANVTLATNEFIEDGDWNDATKWSKGHVAYDNSIVSIKAAATITNGYTANMHTVNIEGGSITINPTGKLHTGTITGATENTLTLESDENGNATLAYMNDSNTPVKATIELYSKAKDLHSSAPTWQYMGVAVSEGVPYSNFKDSWMFRWSNDNFYSDENGGCWEDQITSGSIEPWSGYSITQSKPTTYTYSGTLINENLVKSLAFNSTPDAEQGNNLITNSYTAPIDITKLSAANFTNADAAIIIYNTGSHKNWEDAANNNNNGTVAGQFCVIPVASAIATGYPTTIASQQAFFVHATAEGGKFTINYNDVIYNAGSSNNMMRAPRQSNEFNVLKLNIRGEKSADHLFLLEHADCSDDYDNGYDGKKRFNQGAQIYAANAFGRTSVNCDYSIVGQTIGFVGSGEEDIYTISFDINRLEGYETLYLYDSHTGIYTDILRDGEYSFTATNEAVDNRFRICLSQEMSEEDAPEVIVIGNTFWYDLSQCNIQNPNLYIFDTAGRMIYQEALNRNANSVELPQLPKGVYLVNLGRTTTKIIR